MKHKLFIIVLSLLIFGCNSTKVVENKMYKTKIYAGYYIKSVPYDKRHTTVLTSEGMFRIRGNPDIPKNTWCYIKVKPSFQDVDISIRKKLEPKLLTWKECDKEYLILNNYNVNR